MPVRFIQDPDAGERLKAVLATASSVAVDCEAAGFHRYSDRLCLVQLSTPGGTFVLDPLAMDLGPLLGRALQDPGVPVIMHGAAYDLRLLKRDLGILVEGLVDTQVAASLLGEPGIGLQALLERHVGVAVSKKFQRADWAQRPLSDEMLEYAANDTRYLHALADELEKRLADAGRTDWAAEEYRRVVDAARAPEVKEDVDPVTRVKGARSLDPVGCEALRSALDWRDQLARSMDRAAFRVAPDQALLEVAVHRPGTIEGLAQLKGMSPRLATTHGRELLDRIRAIEAHDPATLNPYPNHSGRRNRPPPEVEEAMEALKQERNQVAEEVGLERGRLMSNQVLVDIALRAPTTLEELLEVSDIRKWQVDLFGDRLLHALQGGSVGSPAQSGSE